MRLQAALIVLAFIAASGAHAGDRPEYQAQRANEDWSALADPGSRTEPLDAVKYVPLGADGAYVSFGGSARWRYNHYAADRFGLGPTGDGAYGILLQRYLLHADVHLADPFRVFVELGHHVAGDDRFPAGPNDIDFFDVSLAFADLKTNLGEGAEVKLRVGRQHLGFGSSRLVALRDGPNVRQRFDGVRATYGASHFTLDIFAARDVVTGPRDFDDGSEDGDGFWGAYAVFGGLEAGNLDVYYLGLDRDGAAYAQGAGVADERRHSMGARFWGKADGWDWNWEAVGQFGAFGDDDIRAWTLASVTGYTFARPGKPRLLLSDNIASGDSDPGDGQLETFNPLFPRLPYFEEPLSSHRKTS